MQDHLGTRTLAAWSKYVYLRKTYSLFLFWLFSRWCYYFIFLIGMKEYTKLPIFNCFSQGDNGQIGSHRCGFPTCLCICSLHHCFHQVMFFKRSHHAGHNKLTFSLSTSHIENKSYWPMSYLWASFIIFLLSWIHKRKKQLQYECEIFLTWKTIYYTTWAKPIGLTDLSRDDKWCLPTYKS